MSYKPIKGTDIVAYKDTVRSLGSLDQSCFGTKIKIFCQEIRELEALKV